MNQDRTLPRATAPVAAAPCSEDERAVVLAAYGGVPREDGRAVVAVLLAIAAQIACDFAASLLRERLVHGASLREQVAEVKWVYGVDVALTAPGLLLAFAVRDRLPDARVELLRGLGHLAHEEAPERVAAAILSEIDAIGPAVAKPGPN